MYSLRKPSLWAVLCCLCWHFSLVAQVAEVTTTTRDLGICGQADTFTVVLQNNGSSTISNVEVTLGLPPGIEYLPGSVNGTGIFEIGNPSPDSVVLGSADIPSGQSAGFSFLVRATCSATDSVPLLNTVAVNHSQGVDLAQSLPFAILRPSLALLSVSPTFGTIHNDTVFQQCITVANGGFGALEQFTLLCEGDSMDLVFTNFRLGNNGPPLNHFTTGDSTWATIDSSALVALGNMDPLFSENEQATICFDVVPRSCNGGNYALKTSWGCNGSTCEEQTFNSNLVVNSLASNLVFSYVENSDDHCRGNGNSVVKLVLENTGTDTSENVRMVVNCADPSGFSWDLSSLALLDTLGGSTSLGAVVLDSNTGRGLLGCYNGPPIKQFEVYLPNLAPGGRDTLRMEYVDCCTDSCHAFYDRWWEGFRLDSRAHWTDECNAVERNRYQSIPSHHSGISGEPVLSGPTDLLGGDTALYCLDINSMELYAAGPGAYFDLLLTVSNGVAVTNGVFFEDEFGTQWHPSAYLQQGDSTRAQFQLPYPVGYSTRTQTLKIPLTGDCNNACGGLSEVKANFRFVKDSTCGCAQSFYCKDWQVNLHCPNCTCDPAGLVFTNLEVKRLNYGLPDNDNNGLPDSTGSLDFSKVASDVVIFGDTLGIKLFGVVDTTGTDAFFTQGHARSFIPNGFHFQPISHTLKVVDFSSGMSHTVPVSPPSSGFFLNDLGTGLAYQYTYDTTGLGTVFGNGYVFEEGDSLILDTRYKVITNVGLSEEGGTMEHHVGLVEADGDTVGCDTFAGSFKLVGYLFSGPPHNLRNHACLGYSFPWMDFRIGPASMGMNIFKYEFRHFVYPDTMVHVLPQGYRPLPGPNNKVRVDYVFEVGSATNSGGLSDSLTVVLSGNVLKAPIGSMFAVNGGNWPLRDEEFRFRLLLPFETDCNFRDTIVIGPLTYDYHAVPALTGTGAMPLSYSRNTAWSTVNNIFGLSTNLTRVPGISKSVAWDINIERPPHPNISNTVGWVQVLSPSGQVVNPVLTMAGSSTPIAPQGNWFPLGNMLPNQLLDLRLQAEYQNCDEDSVLFKLGWSCEPRDSTTPIRICNFDSLWLWVVPQPSQLQAGIALSDTLIDACDTLLMEIDLRSVQLADVEHVGINVVLPLGGGLGYITGSSEMAFPLPGNFAGTGNPSVNGNQLFWEVDSLNALLADGFRGIGKPDSNAFKLRFMLETNCNFISGQQILLEVFGERPCGEALPPIRLLTDPLNIDGAPQPYTTSINANLAQQSNCPVLSGITVSMVNNGPGSSSTGDSIFLDLPAGYQYAGNFVPLSNAPSPNPNVQVFAGGTRLSWPCPTGLAPGDLLEFSFDISAVDDLGCRFDFIPVTSLVNSNMFCARTNSNCTVGIQTGSALVNSIVSLPDIFFQTLTGTRNTVGNNREYLFSGALTNAGQAVAAGDTVWVEFYCDNDQNGVFSGGDVPLGAHPVSVGIPSNGTTNFAGVVTFPANDCSDNTPIMGVVQPNPSQGFCTCDTAQALHNPILSEASILARAVAKAGGNLVSWRVSSPTQMDRFQVESLVEGEWQTVAGTIELGGEKGEILDQAPSAWSNYRVMGWDVQGLQTVSNLVEVERLQGAGFEVFPNPTSGQLNMVGIPEARLHLLDVYSKCLFAGTLDENGLGTLSLDDLPAGVYILLMKAGGATYMEKVVRSR